MVNTGDGHLAAFAADMAGNIIRWNEQCERLFGYPAQEVLQRPYAGIIAALPHSAHEPAHGKHAVQLIRRDGTRLTASLSVLPQYGGDGNLIDQLVLVAVDDELLPKKQFETLINGLPGPFYVIDGSGRFLLWNQKLEQLVGRSAEQLAQAHAQDFFEDQDTILLEQKFLEAFQHGHSLFEARLSRADGSLVPYLFNCSPIMLHGQLCICGMGIDIAKRKQYEEMLHLRERAIRASVNGVIITRCHGPDNLIEYVNPAFEKITGYQEHEVLGRDPRFMRAGELDQEQRRQIREALDERRSIHVALRNQRKDGELFWNDLKIDPILSEDGKVTHFVAVINDVTEAKQSESKLSWLASHDPLTGLANRTLLHEHLENAIHHAHRNKCLVALVFIDLDKFKTINDTLGHEVGDRVLKTVANHLRCNVRESDIVARVGGDEFVLVLASQPNMESIADLVDRLHRGVAEAMPFIGADLSPTVSAGISIYPDDGSDAEILMHRADAAMYHAKAQGRNNYQFYSARLHAAAHQRLLQELSLRTAIEKNQLFLLFQPRVDIRTGRVVGAEALVRWRHPEHGVLTPEAFIPLAEETGLITQLGDWVLTQVCTALKQFQASGLDSFSVSVNLSARQLRQKNFADQVSRHLSLAGLQPTCLEMELTERQLMDHPTQIADALADLRSLGVRLAIDDFGTGYSSLAYLHKFPVDHIKIDQSFVQEIGRKGTNANIARAAIALGHHLNIRVIAEGVETETQYAYLRDHQCDELQGYYFSEPLIAGPLQALLRQPPAPAP